MIERSLQGRRRTVATILGVLALLVGLGAWALASPVGASPDDDYHLASIWCGQGLRAGICEAGTSAHTREVPRELLKAPCFAYKPDASAKCQAKVFTPSGERLVLTNRGNFAGDYPPVFYWVMSHFVGHDVSTSVIAMRLFNCALFVALVAGAGLLVPAGLRRGLHAAFLVTIVPLGLFIVSSVNPSSWAFMSVPVLLVATLGYLTTDDRRRRLALGGLAALALLLGAGSRADAAMYGIVAIGAAVIYAARFDWAYARRVAFPAVLAVIAGWSYLSTGQSSAATAAAPPGSLGPWRIADLVVTVPNLWIGGLGGWGLGWLDTEMPALVSVAAWGIFVAVLFAAIAHRGRGRAIAIMLVGLTAWVVPAYIQYLSGAPVGAYVQPRYVLPLLSLLAATVLVRTTGQALRLERAQRWILVVALAAANAVALFFNLRRYVTGTDVTSVSLDRQIEWWWGLPIGPTAFWFIGATAFAVGIGFVTRELIVDAPAGAAVPTIDVEPEGDAQIVVPGELERDAVAGDGRLVR